MTETVKVPIEKLYSAFGTWIQIKENINGDRLDTFKEFLGIEGYMEPTVEGHHILSPEAARKMDMLLSPHAATVIAAWLITKEGERDVTPIQGSNR